MSSSYTPCAACKFLRRKCTQDCVFAPYFPPDKPKKFQDVHKVFGAGNVAKLLNELKPSQREYAVKALAYEAEYRLRDPVYGCVGLISVLQQRLRQKQNELGNAKKELASYIGPQALLPIQQPQQVAGNPSSTMHMHPNMMPLMGFPRAASVSRGGQLVIREPQQQQQMFEAQHHLAAVAAAREQQYLLRGYEQQQQHQSQQQEIMRFHSGFEGGASPSTATGFNQITTASEQQYLLRGYEQHQHQGQQQEIVSLHSRFGSGASTSVTAAGLNQITTAMEQQDLLRGYEQQQQQHHGHQQEILMFNSGFECGSSSVTATGFNFNQITTAREQQDLLRGYEQQQQQQQHQCQQQDIVRFNSGFEDGSSSLNATGFNHITIAREQQDLLRGYEQQQQQQQHQGQQQEIVMFNSGFEGGSSSATETGFNQITITREQQDLLRGCEQQQQQHQGDQQQEIVMFNSGSEGDSSSVTATGFNQITTAATMSPSMALGSFDNPYQIQTQQQDHPHHPPPPHGNPLQAQLLIHSQGPQQNLQPQRSETEEGGSSGDPVLVE